LPPLPPLLPPPLLPPLLLLPPLPLMLSSRCLLSCASRDVDSSRAAAANMVRSIREAIPCVSCPCVLPPPSLIGCVELSWLPLANGRPPSPPPPLPPNIRWVLPVPDWPKATTVASKPSRSHAEASLAAVPAPKAAATRYVRGSAASAESGGALGSATATPEPSGAMLTMTR